MANTAVIADILREAADVVHERTLHEPEGSPGQQLLEDLSYRMRDMAAVADKLRPAQLAKIRQLLESKKLSEQEAALLRQAAAVMAPFTRH
jgi:hypothetical protein